MQLRFRITDLLLFTAYIAIGAWLASSGFAQSVLIWIGTVCGLEIGKRSDYPTFLVALCGSVMGLAFLLALLGTNHSFGVGGPGRVSWPHLGLAGVAWTLVIAIFFWLLFRVRNRTFR